MMSVMMSFPVGKVRYVFVMYPIKRFGIQAPTPTTEKCKKTMREEDGVLSTTKFTLYNKNAVCQVLSLSDSLLQTVHLINYFDMPAVPIN